MTELPRAYPARPIVGVGGIVLVDDRVVLVKRGHAPLAGEWSLPGGALELGETLEAGVAREILEETGLVVDVGPLVFTITPQLTVEADAAAQIEIKSSFAAQENANAGASVGWENGSISHSQ